MRRFIFARASDTVLPMAQRIGIDQSAQTSAVSDEVIAAVADATETDPLALEPLYKTVDPEALDELFATDPLGTDRSPDNVTFSYNGCDVTITGDGSVHVSQPDSEPELD